jgi:hypothetical protein
MLQLSYTQHKTFLPQRNNHHPHPPQKKKQKKKKEPIENTGSIHNCPKKKKKGCKKTNPPAPLSQAKI